MSNRCGGVSWNTAPNSKKGVETRYKCKHCGRQYKMEWACERHERNCRCQNEVKK